MKVNSILLIIVCLLQVLNSSSAGLNEQTLKNLQNAANKTLNMMGKFGTTLKLFDQYTMPFTKGSFSDLELRYSPLTSDNIQFRFDENGILHVKFVKIKATMKGKFFKRPLFNVPLYFKKELNDLSWEKEFTVAQNELENGKIDREFKSFNESEIIFNRILSKILSDIDIGLRKLDYTSLKIEFRKVIKSIFNYVQSL